MAHVLLEQGFWTLAILTFKAGSLFVTGSCPVHCRMLSSNPSLHPLYAGSIHAPSVTTKNVSRYCQMSPGDGGGQNSLWLRKPILDQQFFTLSAR